MLNALSLALQLTSQSLIVGFRDTSSGVIIPPSIVISDLENINQDNTYEVMIRQQSVSPFQNSYSDERFGQPQHTGESGQRHPLISPVNESSSRHGGLLMQDQQQPMNVNSRHLSTAPVGVERASLNLIQFVQSLPTDQMFTRK